MKEVSVHATDTSASAFICALAGTIFALERLGANAPDRARSAAKQRDVY